MEIKDLVKYFGKQFFIGCLIIGLIISLKLISFENLFTLIPFVLLFILIIIFLFFYKNPETDLSSDKWFEQIKHELEHTTHAIIYLKDFSHPDAANHKHKENIRGIMTEFARLIYEYPDNIKITAYRPISSGGLCPKKWLANKITEFSNKISIEDSTKMVEKSVTIFDKQPTSNNYSFYLVNKHKLLYSQKVHANKNKYFLISLENSVIPYFLENGFNSLKIN